MNDITTNGILCNCCNEIKPMYCYQQEKRRKFGIGMSKCNHCYRNSRCPYSSILCCMKGSSKRRGHPLPEHTIQDLKALYNKQNGICVIRGEKMEEKYCDGNPYNMSPERLDNSKYYTLDNVVLICQKYQISKGNYEPHEIRSWFEYDSNNDGFVFDGTIFNKTNTTMKRKARKVIRYEDKKCCTKCNIIIL